MQCTRINRYPKTCSTELDKRLFGSGASIQTSSWKEQFNLCTIQVENVHAHCYSGFFSSSIHWNMDNLHKTEDITFI